MTERFNLKAARVNKGLSRRELAAMTGVPTRTIERLENGLGARPQNVKPLADLFGVLVTDITPLDESEDRAA